jgi:alpha-1,6-mannosyltransferase
LKVCDINNLYSPTGGGVRTYHEAKLRWFSERTDVDYALIVPGPARKVEQIGRATRIEVPGLPLGGSGYRSIVHAGDLTWALGLVKPDLIELGSVYTLPRHVRTALRRLGRLEATALVGFYHADYPDTYVRPYAQRLGLRFGSWATGFAERHCGRAYGQLSATFGASQHVVDKLAGFGVARLFRTPLGVDTDRFHPRADAALSGLGERTAPRRLLYLARLAPEKGIDLLLQAYPAFRDPARFQLIIGGKGPLEGAVERFVRTFPEVQRLSYLTSPEAVAAAFASADLVIQPGPYETFSLATLEALATGSPVVTADAGGAAELAREFGGETFASGSAGALAEAILRWHGSPPSITAAERAAAVAARYSWNAVFTRMLHHYQDIVAAQAASLPAKLGP